MLYKSENLKINIDELVKTKPREAIIKKLRLNEEEVKNFTILRRSQDARFHESTGIYHVFHVSFEYPHPIKNPHVKPYRGESPEAAPVFTPKNKPQAVIVGAGPAGLFAALRLLEYGVTPLILERGRDIPQRAEDVKRFWEERRLNPQSNVQFGLGGAGTFSDGKLMSRIKSPYTRQVARKFIQFGASPDILYLGKPHLGTDRLRKIVAEMRDHILSCGGVFRFESQVTDLLLCEDKIQGVVINDNEEIPCTDVILAVGNGARDTFEMLVKRGVAVIAKSFAVGVRVEHPQEIIDRYTYGSYVGHPVLRPAEYQLTYKDSASGRSVYSFCNCPGGLVVGAASEEGGVAVNGMSFSGRSAANANSAIVVSVGEDDFPGKSPLAGVAYQRELEREAFVLGGENYNAPVMNIADFLGRTAMPAAQPTVKPGFTYENLELCLPEYLTLTLQNALQAFCGQIEGFDAGVMTAVETRTSSPVRIVRNADTLQSTSTEGLFPAGEGAGYAGGIMSSAVDGMKAADYLMKKYNG